MMNENYILKHIQELCLQEGWTHYELAKHSCLPQSTITNLFKRTNQPTFPTLLKICQAFGITLSQFFAESGEYPDLSPQQMELWQLWNSLSVNNRAVALDYLRFLSQGEH